MSQDIITQIKAKIEQAAEDAFPTSDLYPSANTSHKEGFAAGANFILPLLEKAIEQRDEFAGPVVDEYNPRHQETTWKELETELLKLLEQSK